ncbi:Putative E3 ubiquitin-protein ligase LIN [Seminavis robusta]|uniref:E3 ubiquitin-protein ligase LIN n=1 Tax=Seminavis robusta TaxID=568900 RepID=A0A9N8H2U4_9STRA|nr:Putative E3 ubiquitin-protein ligase LIN [Seminavis robusta]|eukprot:Sro15_g010940.1 Putative E3 ubiquitin-protein ligase LIN (193) ;mRNA; f:30984-31562
MIEIEAPAEYLCPLTLDVMSDPVMSKYGQSFERSEILQWLKSGHGVCPLSRRPLSLQDLVTNHALRLKISEWRKEHGEEETIVVNPYASQIYGFITLPSKDDPTDRTVDEDEDVFFLQLAAWRLGLGDPPSAAAPDANEPQQTTAVTGIPHIGRRNRRQRRRNSTGSASNNPHRQNRSIRRRLRNLFAGPSP